MNPTDSKPERAFKTVAAGAAGAILGKGAIAATGMTAAGMMGGGTGIGAAAGPVGAALGAITGLAAYGVYRLFAGKNAAGPTPDQLQRIDELKTAHAKGFLSDTDLEREIWTVIGYLSVVLALIGRNLVVQKTRPWLREAMVADIAEPKHQPMPKEESALRERLLALSPTDFERHVMSFFQQQGLIAWVTQPNNDGGVDGFARHDDGLIVVQCKRYTDKPVDRPTVQQLRGVVDENHAWRGYLVTTSRFSKPAIECAELTDKLVLTDMDALINWHLGKAKPVEIESRQCGTTAKTYGEFR